MVDTSKKKLGWRLKALYGKVPTREEAEQWLREDRNSTPEQRVDRAIREAHEQREGKPSAPAENLSSQVDREFANASNFAQNFAAAGLGMSKNSGPMHAARPHDPENSDRINWVFGSILGATFVTVLGVGLYGFYEPHHFLASAYTAVGIIGIAAVILVILLQRHRRRLMYFAIAALLSTWFFFGFTIWFADKAKSPDDADAMGLRQQLQQTQSQLGSAQNKIAELQGKLSAAPLAKTAHMALHFFGDERLPTKISEPQNVWRYFVLRDVAVGKDRKGGTLVEAIGTDLFVDFDQPTAVGTITVSSPDMKLPLTEVKEFNNRFAVIVFEGLIGAGTVEINVAP